MNDINKQYFIVFLILLLFQNVLCGLTVYPDHYVETDSPYSSSTLYLSYDIKERQIYKLGYFTKDTTSEIIRSYKHGFLYKPDYSSSDTSTCGKSDSSSSNLFYNSNSIINKKDTRVNNFSEELELLKNYCFGNPLSIQGPSPTLHNTGYTLKYKLAVVSSSESINFKIQVDEEIKELCNFSLESNVPDWFQMTIQSTLSQTNKITMIFICDKTEDKISFVVNTEKSWDKYKIIMSAESNVYISFYQTILEDSTSSYAAGNYDTSIIRTYNGMEKCVDQSGDIIEESNCLLGYACEENNDCQSCDFTCSECKELDRCSACSVLTDPKDLISTTCKINNIDITNFQDFTFDVPLESKEFHERSTFGLWIFISDLSSARTGNSNIYHVALKDRYVLSIIPNEISVGVYCHAYEDLYRKVTTETTIESNYIDRDSDYVLSKMIPTDEQLLYISRKDLSGQWFHATCGLSFDHKKFYINTMINGESASTERALRHENLYYDSAKPEYVENDIFNRHIVQDQKLQVQFRNFGNAGTKIFLKYFILFQEYIPPSYKFMYYDYYNLGTNLNEHILFQVNFNILEITPEYQIKYRIYNLNEITKTLDIVTNKEIDLTAPINFRLLILPKANYVYKDINCITDDISGLTRATGDIVSWDDSKPLICNIYTDTQNDKCISTYAPCSINDQKYIVYPGISDLYGYCDFLCSGPMECNNVYFEKTKPFSTGEDSSFCKNTWSDIYNLFYSCESTETKYYLQYSSFYTPEPFYVTIRPLDSYIIEIWYYPDFFLSDSNRQGKYYFPETYKNYVFYSNVVQAYFLFSEYKTLKVEDQYSTHTTPYYHPYEWNKLVFYGLRKDGRYFKYFIINNMIYDPIEFKHIQDTAAEVSLSYIRFFPFDTIEGTYSQWASGYYRGLRIWNGDKASIPLTVQYDNFFTSAEGRVNSIIGFYPLTNQYISDNRAVEITDDINTGGISIDTKKSRRYNFSSKFDFIRSQYPSLGYYLLADATAPKASQCGTGCLRCWNAGNNCYECAQGYLLTLNRACKPVSAYYFKSPCLDQTKSCEAKLTVPMAVYNKDEETIAITVTFWVKPIGFSSTGEHKIIEYSENDYLYFVEDYSASDAGLTLRKNELIIANDMNFRERIGYWTFISLSYYKQKIRETNSNSYYPQMINFEINAESMPIMNQPPTELEFSYFKIASDFFGLLFNVRYYHEYLIGAYGFATNNGNLITPFSIPMPYKSYLVPGNSASNCFDYNDFTNNNGDNFGCAGDYDTLFDNFATSFNKYIEIEAGFATPKECEFKNDNEDSVSNCLNACKGVTDVSCTCLNRNYNSQMLIRKLVAETSTSKQGHLIYCKSLDYINFSKAKAITIQNVRTAKETKKFTLQFWIYFYNYEKGNFKGSTFTWKGHNKIIVFRDEDNYNKYYTKCQTYTVDDDVVTLNSADIQINNAKWNFISCSVNYEERVFYLNTNNDIDVNGNNVLDGPRLYRYTINPSVPTDFLLNNDYTTLEITDDTTDLEDWGYLYYRQIHLWKYAYFNAEFLSRVDILTPSKFPYLLNSWDTYFKGYKDANFHKNFIVKDICGIAKDFNVTYTGPLGFNYIPLANILHVDLCSEDGEYYDLYLKKCLPFADLGLIDDFTFTEIPYSYSGSYSMGFWIFFEDSSTATAGIHLKWERHLQITVIKNAQLQGFCLPQGYYSDDISNAVFANKLNKIPTYASTNLLRDDQSESGVWIWVLCSVSNYAQTFFIKGNGDKIQVDLDKEDLYYSDLTDAGQPVKSSYVYHYYMSEVENGVSQTSKLYLEGLANDKRIYIRDLFLFKDYIPDWYAEAFKNTDLSLISEDWILQSMVFVCNFADFKLSTMTLTYYVINQINAGQSSTFTKTEKTTKLTRTSKVSSSKTFELCSNFAFIKITNPVQGDLCKYNTNDKRPSEIIYYCNDNKVDIVCRPLYYITYDEATDGPVCSNECTKLKDSTEMSIRVPGAPSYSGICSVPPADGMANLPGVQLDDYYGLKSYTCGTGKIQIGYYCYDQTLDEKSAFFFSRCYNQPNFYGEISNESKEKFSNGYFYEFWFKLDKVRILEHCDTDASEEYILYSTPHSIYLDLLENKYYYKIIDSIYSSTLDGISDYEWNKIVIKTTLGVSLGQNVYVYINFDIDNIKATILNIPTSTKMQLQYISFCSKEDNGDCTPAGAADIVWGSAYYRNIRVWELYSSSIYSIQDFNIDIYTEWPDSLKLFYPLIISKMNYNILSQVVGSSGLDSITVSHEESYDFNSLDAYGFYNYATNFDWGVEDDNNKRRFISSMDGIYITSQACGDNCERCYTNANTNCYKCNVGYVLKGMTCVYAQGKTYLKIPGKTRDPIEFVIDEVDGYLGHISSYPGITIHFYMKFEGALDSTVRISSAPHIMEFSSGTYLYYDTLTAYLDFDIESNTAFQYTTFYDLLGQWIPYSIAIYVGQSPIPTRYPHMFTFSVNKEDIPFISSFTLPETLNRISYIHLGNEVIALFADLRIYNTFIQGSFGHAISAEKPNGLILYYSLTGSTSEDCVSSSMITNGSPLCVSDYIDYIAKSCGSDITKYFDLSIPGEEPCGSCPDYCKTKCFNPDNTQCTCDMTHGLFWLRRDKRTRETYCEYIPSIDYSILQDIEIKVPVSKNFESTIEFWLFIYSYNSEVSQFNQISLEWNLHNRVKIVNKANTINAECYAFHIDGDPSKYPEKITLTITGYTWLYIRCGTDFISQTKKYFLNNQEEDLITTEYPDRTSLDVTTFKIINQGPASFGYVFLREIKLWQQYNFKYINTAYIDLVDDVGLYDVSIYKSTGLYPGLITYIKSEFDPDEYSNVMTYPHNYKIINLIGKDDLGYAYPKTYFSDIKRNIDEFLGYNIVDPDNYGYYDDLLICGEGYVYNSENDVCLEVSLTKCRYPGDVSDNCISCPDENKYIYPPTGNCVSDCGVRYYPRDDMNQCRACHWTCYTCWSYAYNNCLSCIDDRYYVEDLHECVLYCQDYGLVASKVTPNLCVSFDAVVELVNYKEGVPIDINTFDYLIANITYINTKPYYTKWMFIPEKTRNANPGKTLKFEDDEVPFEPNTDENLASMNVSLNHSFFELKTFYIFTLEITSYNLLDNTKKAVRYFDFNLTMNSYPVDGGLQIIPSVGLHNTTIFLMRCQNWTDDTIKNDSELTYYFYAIEDMSTEVTVLQDWSPNNEIISSFILEKDALPSNDITIYCIVRDNYLAESQVEKKIKIVTELRSNIYSLDAALDEYYYPDKQLTPVEQYHLSEVLKSFGLDLYKALRPNFYQTIYKPSIDKKMVVKTDPECITFDKECNYRGECNNKVDEFLVCRCDTGFIGKNCHIEKNSGVALLDKYKELYMKLLSTMQSQITYHEFKVMHNLFNGAQYFAEDPTFYSNQMETFINMAMNVYPNSIDNNTFEYIDLLDYYYSYELERLNKKRVNKMYNTGLPYRDLPIDDEDKPEFKEAFEYIHNKLVSLIHFKCNMHINTQIDYSYSSDNFFIAIKSVNPTFDEKEFFEERKDDYKSYPRFMTCLNYIENTKLNNPYFQTFMIYIEYLSFPFGYDDEIYENNTSPLIEIRFLDATTGKTFDLVGCTGANQINIDMPFTNYRWLDQINSQRDLYDPRNYKAPDDPIFSDPIYINKSGYVSDDTVEQRIKKYHRVYNFSCRYYDIENLEFVDDGVVFTNFTSDTNYIQFNTTHLTRFSTFFVLNNATFKVKGRFFYVPRTELMKWKGNYNGNFGLIVFIILICAYIVFSFVLGCYDSIYFVQETLLESLKKEIVKVFLPYRNSKDKEEEASKIIPIGLDPRLIGEKKFGDKTKENNRYGKDLQNNNGEDDDLDLVYGKPKEKNFGTLNSNRTMINSDERLNQVGMKKSKANEYFSRKKEKDDLRPENLLTSGNRPDLNLAKEMQDFYRTNIGKKEIAELDPNRLPEVFENKEIEYKRRLNGYANLSLSFCQFFYKNFLARNIFLNPFFNISLFAPRWKKLITFTTEVASEMLMLTVFLTNDEKATENNIVLLLEYSIFTVLITDIFMHFMTIFFQVSNRQKRRLLKLVLMGGQLIVLKEYEDMQCVNAFISFIGMLICYTLWAFSFYMSFTFYSVWKVQNKAFIYSFIITVALDFLVLEFLYELFLAIIYMQRKSSGCLRKIGELLNRIRNHRCMS